MAVWEARLPGVLAVGEAAGKGRQSAAGRGPSPMRGAGSGSGAVSERGRGQGSVDCCWGGARGGGGAPRIREPRLRVQASGWGRDDGGCSGSGRAPLRGLRAFHPLHVFYRPLGPPAHADHPECEQYPVPALSHHGCQAKIIQTKSTQCLSFSLTVATLLASASWTLYGLHLRDLYIMVPNIPGILTSLVRLGLFWQYPQVQEKNYSLLQT
ncbi:sugar transporter SWEET1 isoform X3 [Antechinus flavipes]|uniref:sugar transporter SWEET1 isoform X3 n=1 Tax=Antechinus flavipes TaxID=38775 RepID=UPI002236365D|nr:sugar transporter SWEET1 isoform X3 [Antechinus flavipes]